MSEDLTISNFGQEWTTLQAVKIPKIRFPSSVQGWQRVNILKIASMYSNSPIFRIAGVKAPVLNTPLNRVNHRL